jgi:hypothetical protein
MTRQLSIAEPNDFNANTKLSVRRERIMEISAFMAVRHLSRPIIQLLTSPMILLARHHRQISEILMILRLIRYVVPAHHEVHL